MSLAAALVAAAAAWLAVPVPATDRLRALTTVPTSRRRPSPISVATVLTPIACLVVLGPVIGLLVALAATPAARAAVATMATASSRRRDEQLQRQLPVALDLVVAVLASGRPAVVAFEVVGEVVPEPLATELQQVGRRLRSGTDLPAVWEVLARHRVLGAVGRAFRRAEQSGSPVAAVLAAAAADLRRDRASQARERARAVGVRTAAPLGLCFLPAFFLVGIVPTLIGVASGLDLLGG
ncbi:MULTISPECIES: type II secretion system F family protein [unclassified Aeromicrobium]|uniref:type II secretion system F family protein n=1 Tax=unclassified Aeromicrobium TaxID=2633570 RepID=UPI0028897CE8|nr:MULTISPECIES: type II secretion system F family protein [unclassified Aeromicrobium]